MKYLMLFLSLALHFSTLRAQNPIPVKDMMLRDSIKENIQRNRMQLGLLEVIRGQTETIRDSVEATRQLQYEYQTFLRQTASTSSLTLMNTETPQQAVGHSMSTAHHLGDYSFSVNLNQVYQGVTEPMEKSQTLYDALIPFDEHRIVTGLTPFEHDQKARRLNMTALEEMSRRRKLQLASAYRQMAQQKIEQAGELRRLLLTPARFSMTEAERLETLQHMQVCLLQSQQFTQQADQYIQKVSAPSFAKKQALTSFQHQQQRVLLSNTPLF